MPRNGDLQDVALDIGLRAVRRCPSEKTPTILGVVEHAREVNNVRLEGCLQGDAHLGLERLDAGLPRIHRSSRSDLHKTYCVATCWTMNLSRPKRSSLSSFPASLRVIVPPTTSASVIMYVACHQRCFTAIQFITMGCVSAVLRQTRVLALNGRP